MSVTNFLRELYLYGKCLKVTSNIASSLGTYLYIGLSQLEISTTTEHWLSSLKC
jgi:hypothetical protein